MYNVCTLYTVKPIMPCGPKYNSQKMDKDRREGKRSSLLFGGTSLNAALSFERTSILGGWWFGIHGVMIKNVFKASIPPSSLYSINLFLQIKLVENIQRGKELNLFRPPNSSDDLSLSFFYDKTVQKQKNQDLLCFS